MASTSHPLATSTALAILREGGNAVDAAIAASATLCIVEPHMTGIGGDCFAMVCEPDGSLHAINGSGRSAAGAKTEWYLDHEYHEIGLTSAHSVTAPGAVKAWETLHGRFGRMDFARLFADAVGYARNGFPVHARVAHDWQQLSAKLAADSGATRHFLLDGRPPPTGHRMHLPALGEVFSRIAVEGSAAFYQGDIAREIAQTVQSLGGFLSESDLAAVECDWVDPIAASYCDHDIFEIPPNGQGITALILLRLMELAGLPHNPGGGERYYRQTELARLAYGVRDTHIGDPRAMRTQSAALLSDAFIGALIAQFDPDRRNQAIVVPEPPSSDTIYLCVVDSDLRCVSFINSLYSGFGSGIVTRESGIALQNRGSCFVVEAGHVNCIGPSKKPLHTIIPAMAKKNGRAAITFGVMGGAFQPLGHAQLMANILHYGMDPQMAVDFPRLFWEEDGVLLAESGIGPAVRRFLRERGNRVVAGGPHGGGQIIVIDHDRGVLRAGSEPRKDGHAAGY